MEQRAEIRLDKQRAQPWIPRKERVWVFLAIGIASLIVLMGVWRMMQLAPFHTRGFKSFFKDYGSLARLALFFVIAFYVLKTIVQQRAVEQWKWINKGFVRLLRFARKWHTPIAIIAIGLIVLHAVGAVLYGIKYDFHNISGLLALFVLLPVPVAGLFRYRKTDRKWHLRLGVVFTVLFLIHAFL